VDLNPVRAKMATSLEESRLTSVHDRICAKRARLRLSSAMEGEGSRKDAKTRRGEAGSRGDAEARRKKKAEPTDEQTMLMDEAKEEAGRDRWLCRFGNEVDETGGHTVLAMRIEDYLELLEWTGRCVVEGRVKGFAPRDRRGVLPETARPVLERMELEVENWVETVERWYGSIYHRVAGKVENLKRKAQEMGQQWLFGQRKSRGVFRLPRTSRGRKAKGLGAGGQKEPVG
jgi:hypothetical protein